MPNLEANLKALIKEAVHEALAEAATSPVPAVEPAPATTPEPTPEPVAPKTTRKKRTTKKKPVKKDPVAELEDDLGLSEEAEVVTLDEVIKKAREVASGGGRDTIIAALAVYGVPKIPELKPEAYREFLNAIS